MTLSIALIVRNEAEHLADCLETLSFADELIVVDGGSTDATCEIARRYTEHVHVHADWQGFGEQRRRAERHATGDWILMIDADERVTPALRASIEQAIQGPPALYRMPRLTWCFGAYIRHSGWYPDPVIRLYPRGQAGYNDALVHEKLDNPNGLPLKTLTGDLLHYSYRDLRHYLEKSAHYAQAWADQRAARSKTASLMGGIGHALGCFLRMYVLKAGWKDGRAGLLLALLSSHSTFVKYADLWLKHQPTSPPKAP